jgi:antitoxin-like ribbon-helix-helix protein
MKMCKHKITATPFRVITPPNADMEKVKMGRKPKTTGPTARDAGAFKSILTRVNADGWRALRLLAVEKDTTLNALTVEALNDLLRKHGKRASVTNPLLDDQD